MLEIREMRKPEETAVAAEARDLDYEKDSLYILPLQIIPFDTQGLRHARMLKNSQCESMIEVFRDDETGSGQVDPSKVGTLLDWPKGKKHPDGVMVAKLGLLQSFDVYSLRINLRSLGIDVENFADLRLSDAKRVELNRYMAGFTRPLVNMINAGDSDVEIDDINDLVKPSELQGNADALDNLRKLSRKLKIILSQLPAFLADYGDVFLSLAYFKDRYDDVLSKHVSLKEKLGVLKDANGLVREREIAIVVESDLDEIIKSVRDRLDVFDKHTDAMWEAWTAEKFHQVKNLIESNHSTIGGLLCGAQVKLDGFQACCQKENVSSTQLAEYVATYMKPGLDRIKNIEHAAHYANHPHQQNANIFWVK